MKMNIEDLIDEIINHVVKIKGYTLSKQKASDIAQAIMRDQKASRLARLAQLRKKLVSDDNG